MKKTYAIMGMGRFGQFLTQELTKNGADVLIADSNREIVDQFSGIVSDAVVADLSSPESIRSIGLNGIDVVVVTMGSSLESSIMCVMIAKELGVPRVIAKAASERMGEILRRVGADEIVYPEKESALQAAHRLQSETILDYFDLGDDLCVMSIRPKAEWIGKTLSELKLRNRYQINVVALRDQNGKLNAGIDPNKPLSKDVQLLVLGETRDISRFYD